MLRSNTAPMETPPHQAIKIEVVYPQAKSPLPKCRTWCRLGAICSCFAFAVYLLTMVIIRLTE
jgi:hypothetical protein